MTDLVEFLRARLADDERIAREAIADDCGQDGGFEDADWLADAARVRPRFGDAAAALIRRFAVPARVLREVESKRRILDRHRPEYRLRIRNGEYVPEEKPYCPEHLDERPWPCADVQDIAAVYADHPDYREEWKP